MTTESPPKLLPSLPNFMKISQLTVNVTGHTHAQQSSGLLRRTKQAEPNMSFVSFIRNSDWYSQTSR
jgi:hypothetical protein